MCNVWQHERTVYDLHMLRTPEELALHSHSPSSSLYVTLVFSYSVVFIVFSRRVRKHEIATKAPQKPLKIVTQSQTMYEVRCKPS